MSICPATCLAIAEHIWLLSSTLRRRREIDKNVDRLIDDFEVPRATSAPPHLQEGRWGGPQVVSTQPHLAMATNGHALGISPAKGVSMLLLWGPNGYR